MLLQHILTKDIFLRVFGETQYHSENNVATQLEALEQTFFTGDVRRQAIDRLRAYYGVIGRAADEIADHAEKQQFLKALYEDFYKAYNPAAADRLGVVYTPNEIVDFIIRGADYLLQKHFGRRLADDNVQILDPATGTGTFVIIDYLAQSGFRTPPTSGAQVRPRDARQRVAILPYYIASLNIEYTYRERTGTYLEFPNLCFVDTLDNMDWQKERHRRRRGPAERIQPRRALSENWMRVQLQNETPDHQRHHRQPALQRQSAERERQQQEPRVPGDRPPHQPDLHRGQHGPEDQAVRHVQALHPLGLRPPGR